MKLLIVDNNLPAQTPFLMNKYNALNEVFDVTILHHGVFKETTLKQVSTQSILKQVLGAILFSFLNSIKAYVLLRACLRHGIKKGIIRFLLDWPIVKLNPDIIHFEFGTLAIDRIYLKEVINAKMIVSFRGYDINYFCLSQPACYSKVWKLADGFHFLGQDLFERAKRRGYDGNTPNFFISPAVDIELFKPTPFVRTLNTIQIVSNGRLVWKKGYEYALQAIQLLLADGYDFHYTIIGDGNYREAIQYTIHQMQLTRHVTLLGYIPHYQVVSVLNQSDIFLHAAVSEGFCNAVVEAQAMQLPVVCTNADGLSENIEHGETGFVVPAYDVKAIYMHLKELLDKKDQMKQMGVNGRKRVLERYVLANQIQSYINMYNTFMSFRYEN